MTGAIFLNSTHVDVNHFIVSVWWLWTIVCRSCGQQDIHRIQLEVMELLWLPTQSCSNRVSPSQQITWTVPCSLCIGKEILVRVQTFLKWSREKELPQHHASLPKETPFLWRSQPESLREDGLLAKSKEERKSVFSWMFQIRKIFIISPYLRYR